MITGECPQTREQNTHFWITHGWKGTEEKSYIIINQTNNTHIKIWKHKKVMQKRNFIILNVHIRKDEMAQIYNLNFHLNYLERKIKINQK